MFSKLKSEIEEEEYNITDAENEKDLIDEGEDILTSRICRREADKEFQAEKEKLDSSLEDLV